MGVLLAIGAIQSPAAGAVLGATGVGNAAQREGLADSPSNPSAVAACLIFFISMVFSPR